MSAVRENAKISALELVSDMLRSQFANAAGDVAELQSTLTKEVAEKDRALAEVETLKAKIAELEVPRKPIGIRGQLSDEAVNIANQPSRIEQGDGLARIAIEGDN